METRTDQRQIGLMRRISEASAVGLQIAGPILTGAFRIIVLILAGVSLYAFNAYKHNVIVSDNTVVELMAGAAKTKDTIATHDSFILAQQLKNQEMDADFKQCSAGLAQIDQKLAALLQHGLDQDERLKGIERRLDK